MVRFAGLFFAFVISLSASFAGASSQLLNCCPDSVVSMEQVETDVFVQNESAPCESESECQGTDCCPCHRVSSQSFSNLELQLHYDMLVSAYDIFCIGSAEADFSTKS